MRANRSVLLLSLLLLACAPALQAASGSVEDPFETGLAAYRAGNFELALEHFHEARAAGDESPQLRYNIGLALLQLERLDAARREFLALREFPQWAELAEYRLAQVAERQQHEREAIDMYSGLVDKAGSPRLRRLAAYRAERLATGRDSADGSWLRLLSVSRGRDSNVIALPDGLQQSSGRGEDDFTDMLAYLTSNAGSATGFRFEAFAFRRDYGRLDDFDSNSLGLGLAYTAGFENWNVEYRSRLSRSSVGGATLQRDLLAGVTASTRGEAGQFSLGYEFTRHAAGADYPQLDGRSQLLFADWQVDNGDWRWRAGYGYERVDRADLVNAGNRYSYSPRRHSLEIETGWQPAQAWKLGVGLRYSDSSYDGENRLLDLDGQFRSEQRNGRQLRSSLELEYRLHDHWRLNLDLRHYDNDDNFRIYRYQREIISFGISTVF